MSNDVLEFLISHKVVNPAKHYKTNNNIHMILANNQEIIEQIQLATHFIPNDRSVHERLFCIINNITHIPLCRHCGIPTTYNKNRKLYNTFCTNDCATHSEQRKTNTKLTNKERYGTDWSRQNKQVQEKSRASMLRKYGVEYSGQSMELQRKRKDTCMEKYNVENPAWQHYSPEIIESLTSKDWLINQHLVLNKSQWCIAGELGVSQTAVHYWFKRHNIKCINTYSSSQEHDLVSTIGELIPGIIIEQNVRGIIGRKELDIVLPQFNLALEINGTYWHSELNGKDRQYHLSKTVDAADVGIRLIHIYEHQLQQHRDVIISRIGSLLNVTSKIYARNCTVRVIDNETYKQFVNKNHLQGYTHTESKLALIHNDEIVAVMSFGRARFKNPCQWELVRFCCKMGYTVVGGASKLFKSFIKSNAVTSIVSYSLRDWGIGGIYETLGFRLDGFTSPSYWYITPSGVIENRIKFQKHKLNNILSVYDDSLSEWDNMKNNKYDRIWNCGNVRWIWENTN